MAPLLAVPIIFGGMILAFFGEGLFVGFIPPTKAERDRNTYLTVGDSEKADALKEESARGFRRRCELAHWLAVAAGLGIAWAGAVWGFG